jgi:glutaminyl-tRNA synthetase
VRLRYGYIVTCTGFDKNAAGEITAVHCAYDPATRGGNAPDNRKVKGTIHWLNAARAVPLEARLYDYLFKVDRPMETPPGGRFIDNLNPDSLETVSGGYGEPLLAEARPGDRFQFERLGYFVRDPDNSAGSADGSGGRPVFNRTVGLRDTWGKIAAKGQER